MLIEPGNHPFCDNIRYLKKRYCLSRRAFARLIGVSEYTITDWETGLVPAVLYHETCKRICAVFDIQVEQLFHSYLDPEHKPQDGIRVQADG